MLDGRPAVGARPSSARGMLDGVNDLGLQHFVDAQDAGGTYDRALAELRAGAKRSHWMWFVFPQLAGLGRSETARRYAIADLDQAVAYVDHPVLGQRLRECARALVDLGGDDPVAVLGEIDATKLRSSMTLFATAAPGEAVFGQVLRQYHRGVVDPATAERLAPER